MRSLMQMAAFVEPHVEAFADLPLNSSDSQQEQVGFCVGYEQTDCCPAGTGPACSCMTWPAEGKLKCTLCTCALQQLAAACFLAATPA